MKFLKNLFAFLIPLLSMLITFSIFLLINNVVDNYKSKISRDYSIIIVTINPLEKNAISKMRQNGWQPDYLTVRRQQDLQLAKAGDSLVVLGAARIGSTRLIDNFEVENI